MRLNGYESASLERQEAPVKSSGIEIALPYPIFVMVGVWVTLAISMTVSRCRKKQSIKYLLPRVFVMCSPKTVQFHYELVLRVGLPSANFNPDKHDVDLTIIGANKHEIVPVTRLPTRILLDNSLKVGLNMIVYRLVEMPTISAIIARHCGPLKSWLYAYDFSIKDLATGKEQYYPLNQYIGSLQRVYPLVGGVANDGAKQYQLARQQAKYPIDDVPLPVRTSEEAHMIVLAVTTYLMFSISVMPVTCGLNNDLIAIMLSSLGSGALYAFLVWLTDYKIKWSRARAEYFNEPQLEQCALLNRTRYNNAIFAFAIVVGTISLYLTSRTTNWKDGLIWTLAVVDTTIIVLGGWHVMHLFRLGEAIVELGLKVKKVELVKVGLRTSDLVVPTRANSKSGSQSNDGLWAMSQTSSGSKLQPGKSFGPRSSVKSFGFETAANVAKYTQETLASPAGGATTSATTTIKSSLAMSSTGASMGKLANRLKNKTDGQGAPQSPGQWSLSVKSTGAPNPPGDTGPGVASSIAGGPQPSAQSALDSALSATAPKVSAMGGTGVASGENNAGTSQPTNNGQQQDSASLGGAA